MSCIKPMDFYACVINSREESLFFLLSKETCKLKEKNECHMRKLDSYLCPQTQESYAAVRHLQFLILFQGKLFLYLNKG